MKSRISAVVLALISAYLLVDWAFAPSHLSQELAAVELVDAKYSSYKGGELNLKTADGRVSPLPCEHIQALCEAAKLSNLTGISVTTQWASWWQGRWLLVAETAGTTLIAEVDQARKYSSALRRQLGIGAGFGLAAILMWFVPMPVKRARNRTSS